MSARHAHGGDRDLHHGHAPASFGRAFLIGIGLNLAFVAIEAVYGFAANSMALLADAGHNLSDVLGLLVAWGAATLTKKPPTERFTYGFRKTSVLAALFNALFLLVAVGAIAYEAIRRLSDPQAVAGGTIMVVAAIGVVVNGLTAWLFARGRKGDINIRGAFLHMAADAGLSAGVIVAGLVISRTGWLWLDPVASLVIVAFIFAGTWSLLRESVGMSLDAVPAGIDPGEVESSLASMPGVERVHDLHIWPMSTTEVALTCHLVVPAGSPGDGLIEAAAGMLLERFGIDHTTLQIETTSEASCGQAAEGSL
ncbi:MAG: cobalt-zinc-cadmium efflux system protein [Sphingomonadales bacterium]|jgi:cobalt-zinc-cadmium efflux system protein|nr:cobalt-zinc-cadmium efflux system protein [Sphingomonadales bacterium]